jgi:hypothetical protein
VGVPLWLFYFSFHFLPTFFNHFVSARVGVPVNNICVAPSSFFLMLSPPLHIPLHIPHTQSRIPWIDTRAQKRRRCSKFFSFNLIFLFFILGTCAPKAQALLQQLRSFFPFF